MSAIKRPVRIEDVPHEDRWEIIAADNSLVAHPVDYPTAESIVAALNRAPALAALEEVAREALEDAQKETQDLYPELDDQLFRGCSKGDVRATRQAIERAESRQVRIKAALALASATIDGKDK